MTTRFIGATNGFRRNVKGDADDASRAPGLPRFPGGEMGISIFAE